MSETHAKRKEPAAILIVQEEEVFSGFLQHFPAGRYALLYAAGAAEALALCETRPPKLIILPGGPANAGLTEALREVSRKKAALLAIVKGTKPGGDPPAGIDRVVPADDLEAIIEASTDLLKERREKPRVLVEIPIRLDEEGEGVARDLSANFMQIHTREKLKSGQRVKVEIGWGDKPFQFNTKVFKADTSVLGATVAMLEVEKKPATREYLESLVKRILEVEHYLQGTSKRLAPLRGPMAWKLARRAEGAMRDVGRGSQVSLSEVKADDKPMAAAPDPSALESRYHLLDKLGEWGIGMVHNATHQLLNRPVCVKVLRKELHKNEAARIRMEQEAKVASALISEQVVDVLDFGEDGEGGLYYAMEALEGQTLAEAVTGGEFLTAVEAVTVGVDAAMALKRAHGQKLGHHDLCPANIFLAESADGHRYAKLINFAGELPLDATEAPVVQGAAYRPPESSSMPPSPAYDIYALGATLWDVLGAGGSNVVAQVIKPGDLSPGERRLREILQQARAPARKDRFLSMTAFEEALQECLGLLKDQRSGSRSRIASTTLKPVSEPRFEDFEENPLDEITIPWPAAKLREIADRAAEKKAAENKAADSKTAGDKAAEAKPIPGSPAALKAAGIQSGAPKALGRITPQKAPKATAAAPMQLTPRPRPQTQDLETAPDAGTLLGVPSPRPPGPLQPVGKAAPDVTKKKTEKLPPSPTEGTESAPPPPAEAAPLPPAPLPPAPAPAPERLPEPEPEPEIEPEPLFDPSMPLMEATDDLAAAVHEDAPASLQASPTPEPLEPGVDRRKLFVIGGVVVGVILVAALAFWLWPRDKKTGASGKTASTHQPGTNKNAMGRVVPAKSGTPDAGARVAPRKVVDAGAAAKGLDAAASKTPDAAASAKTLDAAAAVDADPEDNELTPKEKRNRLMGKAYTLLRRGRYAESRGYLTRALKIDDSSRLRRYFSQSYEKVGKFWPAIYHMKKAVKFSPRSARQHAKLGMLYLRVGQYGNACRSFRYAVRYKPGYKTAKRQLDKHCAGK